MSDVLKVNALHKRVTAGGITRDLFSDVSFTINRGEFVALTGRSGSGKTTLLNTLSGIEPVDSGEIVIQEHHIQLMNEAERARFRLTNVGLVFQFFHLLPTLTLKENILLPSRFTAHARDEVQTRYDQLIEATGIGSVVNQYPHQVSGGEAQRTAIARALINQPSILLADEPTGNLDVTTAETIFALFKSLQNAFSLTILMVTHEQGLEAIVDRTFELTSGALAQ